jgi:hypothetical protein
MQMTTPTTRRRALGRMGIALAGAIGVGAGGTAALGGTRSAAAIDRNGQLLLHAAGLRTAPGLRDPRAARTEHADPFAELLDDRRTSVGMFRTASVGSGSLHTFELPHGLLLGLGAGGLEGTSHAVVGGTGRYAGATGTYSIAPAPELPGRSLTFAFTLILPTPEA